MKFPIALLDDPGIQPLPTYTACDVDRAWTSSGGLCVRIGLRELARLDRSIAEVLVLPYLDGDLSGAPLEGLIRFHKQGGGLVFLGDTPHVGRSYPYRNSQAPELRLTRCRDPLVIRGLTDLGREILGDLPGWNSVIPCSTTGVRTSAFAPDECHDLLVCEAGFKQLSPIVLVERRHPDFLGAKAVVVGFDGGEPRENILGVCKLDWSFHPGLLTRDWEGADSMVGRLIEAARPARAAFALELNPVLPAGRFGAVSALARNLTDSTLEVHGTVMAGGEVLGSFEKNLAPGSVQRVAEFSRLCELGPQDFSVHPAAGEGMSPAMRTRFGFLHHAASPSLNMGFSTYRVFRRLEVDDTYRDFLHTTGRLGMQYVRMNIAWEDVEPEPGRYSWEIPDQMLSAAAGEGLAAFFWVFPTARGSGLADAGVPQWTLREPSIDRFGNPGNFPCIWSPFYRKRFFAFLEALTTRYARDPRLARFVFDFGNSDFAYSYHYYGDRGDLFDYSPHEQRAFQSWLREHGFPLEELSRRWRGRFKDYSEVPVPLSEEKEAWLLYEEFRAWGVHHGIKQAVGIIQRLAPDKAPPDFPGHGLGSIADIGTYVTHAQCSRWDEVSRQPQELVEVHNMGAQWGGEAWQVGGRFPDYDDAVFQSVRLEADYFSIPGPDLGIWENDVARIAMIRRSLAGAKRERARIAIMDRMAWNDWGSLCQIGVRLDQPVDLVSKTCRYDYSCYDLLVLPPDELIQTNRGGMSLLPLDSEYYSMILDAVQKGLKVLLFPRTGFCDPLNPMRRLWGLESIVYGECAPRVIEFPDSWGGGVASGSCRSISTAEGNDVLLQDRSGDPLLVFRPFGKGGFLLAGYDMAPDSLDGPVKYDEQKNLGAHTLARLVGSLGIKATRLDTGQAGVYKEYIHHPASGGEFLLFYSHLRDPLPVSCRFRSTKRPRTLRELSTGAVFNVINVDDEWSTFDFSLPPIKGHYFNIECD